MPETGAISEDRLTQTKRQRYETLRAALARDRSTFENHWWDLGDYILPRRIKRTVDDTNKGDRRNQKIIDSTATLAARTLRAGMMGGITSPARSWFRLTLADRDLSEFGPVRFWLDDVAERIRTLFLRSNIYNSLPTLYGDMGVFATGGMFVEEDFEQGLRSTPLVIGSYFISNNERLQIDVMLREFQFTVRQVLEKFLRKTEGKEKGLYDWTNVSGYVRSCYDRDDLEQLVTISHVIEPNAQHDPNRLQAKFKPYASCYFEKGTGVGASTNYLQNSPDQDKYLRESGFDHFPALFGRWERSGEDAYGTECPGMAALGDVKALQLMHKRKSQAIEKSVNPPMTGPVALKNQKATILPGDITYVDVREGQQGFRPAHEVKPDLAGLVLDIQDHQSRIKRAFFEDLFLMLALDDRNERPTAREVIERKEEKLLVLGPVLEQLNQDVLDRLIDISFTILLKRGEIPPPPDEIAGMPLKVEYISIMAQAQKSLGLAGIERFAGFVGSVVKETGDTTLLDKVDRDQLVDEYANAAGVPPRIVRSDDDVAELRGKREQAAAASRATEMAREMAGAAKDLSQAKLDDDSALGRMVATAEAGNLVPQRGISLGG